MTSEDQIVAACMIKPSKGSNNPRLNKFNIDAHI